MIPRAAFKYSPGAKVRKEPVVGHIAEVPGLELAGKLVDGGHWLLCDGMEYRGRDYPALYKMIGKTYGGRRGCFKTPDLRGSRFFYGNKRTYFVIKAVA